MSDIIANFTKEQMKSEITPFNICANRDLNYFPSHYRFLRLPGGGICYDYGVYYLTALVELLGPVESLFSVVNLPNAP